MKLVVSPMAGVTDAPFRKLAIANGADYAISEMITSQTNLWDTPKTQQRLKSDANEPLSIIQIAGASPKIIADAAIACASLKKLDAIEINMGCPAKKVCNVLAGSALLKEPLLVKEILSSAVNVTNTPIYLKTRLGWDHNNKNILDIAIMAEEVGIQSLAIHGRTRSDMYNGTANYDLIALVKKCLSIPVFANGDITTPEKALSVIDATNVDGLYIGRGALGRPWLFQQIKDYIDSGYYSDLFDRGNFFKLVIEHIKAIHDHYGETSGVKFSRKHFKWYLQANPIFLNAPIQNIFYEFSLLNSFENQLAFIDNLAGCVKSKTFFI